MDEVFALIRNHAPEQKLKYNQQFVGLTDGHRSRNFMLFKPRKGHLRVEAKVAAGDEWRARLEEAGLSPGVRKRRVWVNLTGKSWAEHRDIIDELVREAITESQGL